MSQQLGLVPSSMIEQKTLLPESFVGGKLCEPNDLILNRLKAHLGVFALANCHGIVSPDYTVFRMVKPISMQYYEYVLRSPACRHEFRTRAKGIVQGFWRLYTDDFYDIRLPLPPLEEQMEIVAIVAQKLSSLNSAAERTQREIDLIQEYRTRLIADVVTGKVDVRAAVVPVEAGEEETVWAVGEVDDEGGEVNGEDGVLAGEE